MAAEPLPRLSISWTNAPRQDLLLEFGLGAAPTPEQLTNLEGLVGSFVTAGGHGAFAREMAPPSDSSLVLTRAKLLSPMQPAFLLTGCELDVRAFQLVRHLAWRWSARMQPVHSVTVSDLTPGQQARMVQLPDATWGTEAAAYPPLSQRLQIRVEREDPGDYQKERRCVVEFSRSVPDDVFESLLSRIGEWVALMGQGAYGPPVRSAYEAEVWQENLSAYDKYSTELAFSLFEASEFAWNTLLNSLQHYSLTVEHIALVTIE